jgi:hypothetical protein
MSPRTTFLCRLLGLYYLLAAVAMGTHKSLMVDTVRTLLHDSPVMLLVSIVTLLAGLAMVLAHNVWSAGAVPIVVTLLGWLTVIKGLSFWFLSPDAATAVFLRTLHYEQFFYGYAAFSFLLGAFLTYAGFRPTSHQTVHAHGTAG